MKIINNIVIILNLLQVYIIFTHQVYSIIKVCNIILLILFESIFFISPNTQLNNYNLFKLFFYLINVWL